MAAASLSKLIGKNLDISLIESDEIPTVGVGEATIPSMLILHRLLQIDEKEFVAAVHGTFKLGIAFENWRDLEQDYIHSFGYTGKDSWAAGFQHFWLKGRQEGISKDFGEYCPELMAARENKFAVLSNQTLNYAYHIDAGRYAGFLRQIAEAHGSKRVEGKIVEVGLTSRPGHIENVKLESGKVLEGDLFIDCTGFRGLLIEQTLHTGYDDWSHWLPCDSAVRYRRAPGSAHSLYARDRQGIGLAMANSAAVRVGNGLVYCSRYLSDDEAIQTILDNVEGETITEPRSSSFVPGNGAEHWNKNCVAMGLASGFIEPLESTSIHLIQRSIIRLMQMFPYNGIREPEVNEFNRQMDAEIDNIRDFIVLHYHVTNREDTASGATAGT